MDHIAFADKTISVNKMRREYDFGYDHYYDQYLCFKCGDVLYDDVNVVVHCETQDIVSYIRDVKINRIINK